MASYSIVHVRQGQLKGKVEQTKNGFKFNSFLGIPYAKPPVGALRFKAPVIADAWEGIRDATKEGENCYCKDFLMNQMGGSEDCLFINIFTPELPVASSKPKAVMVWIHGGGFMFGSSKREQYGPEFLIQKDIVLVTFNYRLGILGFLTLDDKSLKVPKNVGLKDQVLALRWVKENIQAFGGDPNNVTIFGESAGASSVHFHLLSLQSKGLFHKAVMQSGTSLCPWSYGQSNGLEMCKLLKKEVKNEAEALAYLQSVPVEELIAAQNIYPDLLQPGVLRLISPVVEDSDNAESFLSEHPLKLVATGNFTKVPVLIGYNSEEGLLYQMIEKMAQTDLMFTNFEDFIPVTYGIPRGSPKAKEIAARIKKFYYGNEEPSKDNKHIFYKILSDALFVRGTYAVIESTLQHSTEKLFLYRLSLNSELSQFSKFAHLEGEGVTHAEDLFYLFYHSLMTPDIADGSVEDVAIHRMTTWWSNFAKYSDPNGVNDDSLLQLKWPPADAKNMQCMDINTSLSIQNAPDEKYMKFWQSIEEFALSKL